ncbi:hypothetical protein HDV01_007270 [Terramyces sp. JEL0728]|nr:hypothetical protein HDV01_007270 [Terramyces sp. JEL0728]
MNILMHKIEDRVQLVKLEYSNEFQTYYGEYLPTTHLEKRDYDTIVDELNKHKKCNYKYITIAILIFPIIWTIVVVGTFPETIRWLIIVGWFIPIIFWMCVSIVDSKRIEYIKITCANLTSNYSVKGITVEMDGDVVGIFYNPGLLHSVDIAVNALPAY